MKKICTRNGVLRIDLDEGDDEPAQRRTMGIAQHDAADPDDERQHHAGQRQPERSGATPQQVRHALQDGREIERVVHFVPPLSGSLVGVVDVAPWLCSFRTARLR